MLPLPDMGERTYGISRSYFLQVHVSSQWSRNKSFIKGTGGYQVQYFPFSGLFVLTGYKLHLAAQYRLLFLIEANSDFKKKDRNPEVQKKTLEQIMLIPTPFDDGPQVVNFTYSLYEVKSNPLNIVSLYCINIVYQCNIEYIQFCIILLKLTTEKGKSSPQYLRYSLVLQSRPCPRPADHKQFQATSPSGQVTLRPWIESKTRQPTVVSNDRWKYAHCPNPKTTKQNITILANLSDCLFFINYSFSFALVSSSSRWGLVRSLMIESSLPPDSIPPRIKHYSKNLPQVIHHKPKSCKVLSNILSPRHPTVPRGVCSPSPRGVINLTGSAAGVVLVVSCSRALGHYIISCVTMLSHMLF